MNLKKPWLWLPPSLSHKIMPHFLRLYGRSKPFQTLTWQPFIWRDLEFTSPLGLAGGVDKNGDNIEDWWCLGPGFVEVGTVTPQPQEPNPGKTLDRSLTHQALWNHMGFPNFGVKHLAKNLSALKDPHFTPVFVNVGKNRETSLDNAHEDYIVCMSQLRTLADVFVLNISSPNTEGLRDLFGPGRLRDFLQKILSAHRESHGQRSEDRLAAPVLLKLSPDLDQDAMKDVLTVAVDLNIDGFVLGNSTTKNSGLPFPTGTGGVSGGPLKELALSQLKFTKNFLGDSLKDRLMVSAGGVLNADDVFERLRSGAHLVQVYSALIFSGPFFFREVAEAFKDLPRGL